MKIAMQITTATLGDIVIEEMEDKTTTNKKDQQAILVELIFSILRKAQAVYEIPTDMMDLGEYTSAEERFHEERKAPKSSSAAHNREKHFTATTNSVPSNDIEEESDNDNDDEEFEVSEQELALVFLLRKIMGKE